MDMPFKVELWMATWMDLLRPSAIRMKRKGESGSPCLMPLEGLNVEVGMPLSKMEKKEEEVGMLLGFPLCIANLFFRMLLTYTTL